jgi:hypothetical protein
VRNLVVDDPFGVIGKTVKNKELVALVSQAVCVRETFSQIPKICDKVPKPAVLRRQTPKGE